MPYRGAAPALTDLLGGQVEAFFADVPVLMPQITAGKVRPLGAASSERNPMLPDVPTLAELGYPDTSSGNWYGLLAPAKTPPAVIAKLNAAFVAAINDPVVKDKLIKSGAIPVADTPAQFGQFLKEEFERWGNVVREQGHQGAELTHLVCAASNLAGRHLHCRRLVRAARNCDQIRAVRINKNHIPAGTRLAGNASAFLEVVLACRATFRSQRYPVPGASSRPDALFVAHCDANTTMRGRDKCSTPSMSVSSALFVAIAALGHVLLLVAVYPNAVRHAPLSDIAEAEFATARTRLAAKSGIGSLRSAARPVFAGHRIAPQFRQGLASTRPAPARPRPIELVVDAPPFPRDQLGGDGGADRAEHDEQSLRHRRSLWPSLQSVARPDRARFERGNDILGQVGLRRASRLNTPGTRRPNRPRSATSGVRTLSP